MKIRKWKTAIVGLSGRKIEHNWNADKVDFHKEVAPDATKLHFNSELNS